tara:strand:- start:269 stop:538 length:270 start_codon:yes stop_codon:yes gene_type:complete
MRFDDLNESHVYWLNEYGSFGKRTYTLGRGDIAFMYLGKLYLAEGTFADDPDVDCLPEWTVREVSVRELYASGSYWAPYAADEAAGLND